MTITIDKNVPIPTDSPRNHKWRQTLEKLKPGESFVAPQKARAAITQATRATGKKFTTRRIDDATMRVWCVSEAKK